MITTPERMPGVVITTLLVPQHGDVK